LKRVDHFDVIDFCEQSSVAISIQQCNKSWFVKQNGPTKNKNNKDQ